MSVKRGTPNRQPYGFLPVGKLDLSGIFASASSNLTVRSDRSAVDATPATTTRTLTGFRAKHARSVVRNATVKVARTVVIGACLPVLLFGFGAGSFLRSADGSGAEVASSKATVEERSMAEIGMASTTAFEMVSDEVRTNGMMELVLRDGLTQAERAANPLRPRTHQLRASAKVEPIVLGAAMEVAIALPRE